MRFLYKRMLVTFMAVFCECCAFVFSYILIESSKFPSWSQLSAILAMSFFGAADAFWQILLRSMNFMKYFPANFLYNKVNKR